MIPSSNHPFGRNGPEKSEKQQRRVPELGADDAGDAAFAALDLVAQLVGLVDVIVQTAGLEGEIAQRFSACVLKCAAFRAGGV